MPQGAKILPQGSCIVIKKKFQAGVGVEVAVAALGFAKGEVEVDREVFHGN
ncbi:MAG: hypothetical protein DDT18_01710 [Actinobacteria bacterium]|nr:hypothetical protein [Actinomycetota bacterium]